MFNALLIEVAGSDEPYLVVLSAIPLSRERGRSGTIVAYNSSRKSIDVQLMFPVNSRPPTNIRCATRRQSDECLSQSDDGTYDSVK